MARFIFVSVYLLAFAALNVGLADTIHFVKDGKAIALPDQGESWSQTPAGVVSVGPEHVVRSGKSIGSGDVTIHVRLQLRNVSKSAASFMIDSSHFGFEGRTETMFVEGNLFPGEGPQFLQPWNVPDNQTFDFDVRRRGTNLTFAINGKVAFETEVPEGELGEIKLRPFRSKMTILDWSADWNVVDSVVEHQPPLLVDVYRRDSEGSHTHRIPALITTTKETLLAFCEARRSDRSDAGNIDIVVKRSEDGGITWSDAQTVWDDEGNTCSNPAPVVDQSTGRIWLPLTWNLASDQESNIMAGKSAQPRRVFITYSDDDGKTWATAIEISDTTRKQHWRWYATGPGNSIQLTRGPHSGRLVVPCNHSDHSGQGHPYRSHVIYSDDHGATWKLGGIHTPETNESCIVELEDGSILDNMRSYAGRNRRAVATSNDGGTSWSKTTLHPQLIEPVCQASMLRYNFAKNETPGRILFANPASEKRDRMTVRVSYDDGTTWPLEKMIYANSSAYSSMTVLPDGSIGILFERDDYAAISFGKFTIDWLENE